MNSKNVHSEEKINVNEDYGFAEVEIIYRRQQKAMAKVKSSNEAYHEFLKAYPKDRIDYKEFFYVMLMSRSNHVLGIAKIGEGSTSSVVVNQKEIFQLVLKSNASSFIISHNHPSGQLRPSEYDISLTKKISEFAKLIDVLLLDHIIVTSDSFYSFTDEGLLQ